MRSPLKTKSPNKSIKKCQTKNPPPIVKVHNQKLYHKNYFCHYSNSVYMGGMDCFKKQGKGVIFMDNGACAITEYTHDVMIGHNVVFRDRSLTSILVNLNRTKSVCYRTGPHLLYLNLTKDNKIQGTGLFIHYIHRKISKLKFEDGELVMKQKLSNLQSLKKVFDENNLKKFIEQQHIDALNINLKISDQIKCVGLNDRHIIGFCQGKTNKKPFLARGLCFKVFVSKVATDFDVILQERGYLEKDTINYFGQKHFQNGNYYVGQFNKGKFDGKGILIYPREMKWTYGEYKNGQLKEVIESSVDSELGCEDILFKLHKSIKPFLQTKVQLNPSQNFLKTILKEIQSKDSLEYESIQYANQQQKKNQNLKAIQADYTVNTYNSKTQQVLKELLYQRKEKKDEFSLDPMSQSKVGMKKCLSEYKFKRRSIMNSEQKTKYSKSTLKKAIKQVQEQKEENPQFKINIKNIADSPTPYKQISGSIFNRMRSSYLPTQINYNENNRSHSPVANNFYDPSFQREMNILKEARRLEIAQQLLQTAEIEAQIMRNLDMELGITFNNRLAKRLNSQPLEIERNPRIHYNYIDQKNPISILQSRKPYLPTNGPIY